MKKLVAFVLDADAVQKAGESGVRLFVKTPRGASKRLFAQFEAYFYLLPTRPEAAEKEVPSLKAFARGKQVSVKRVEKVEKILSGKKTTILKVFAFAPGDVPALREVCRRWGETFEDDIPFTRRFLIDNAISPGGLYEFELRDDNATVNKIVAAEEAQEKHARAKPHLNVLAFDIETHNPQGATNPKSDPCIMISYAYADDVEKQGVITYAKKVHQPRVKVVEGEKEMIEEFCRLVSSEKVDLLAGYNSDEFDLPYLMERAKALKMELRLGRDRKSINLRKLGLRRRARISGRIHFDAFTPINFLNFIGAYKFPRLTLGAVHKELFGEEKLDTKKTEIWRAWDAGGEQLKHLLEYSKADALACLRITQKILPLEMELAKVTGLTLFEASRATPGQMVESLLIRAAFQRGEIVPQKPGFSTVQSRLDDAIKGAFVKVPSPGLYERLAVFDFRSLYPSIITSHNIDLSTLNCDCCKGSDNPNIAPTGDHFCTKKRGVIPETLEKVLKERFSIINGMKKLEKNGHKHSDEYRQLDARKFALKILANSFYGYLVYSRSRYYSRESGEATTAWARQYIQDTISKAEESGFQVLYSDSVTSERCVPYLDEKGILRVEPVEEIFEKYSQKQVVVGEKQIIHSPGIKVLSADPQSGKAEWRKATKIIRHLNAKRVFRVRQKTGETRVTEDHSLMAWHEGKLGECRPEDLGQRKIGFLREIPPVKTVEKIDLLEWLGNYSYKRKYKGRPKTAEIEANEDELRFGWMKKARPISIKRIYRVSSNELRALCRILGAYIAEGSSSTPETTQTRVGASIATGSEFWLKQLQNDYNLVFKNATANIIPSMPGERTLTYSDQSGLSHTVVYKDQTLKLQMMNSLAAVIFKQLCGQKSAGKHLPEFIFHLSSEYKLELLKQMIYGDGSTAFGPAYSAEYKANNFRYETRSLRLASGLCTLLGQIGQNYSLRYNSKKETWAITTSSQNNSRLGTKITEEKYEGFVYDFEVEGSHLFADACGNLLLHNTDSCFMLLGDKSEKDALDFQKKINSELPGTMEFELEDFYPRGIFVSKKQGDKGAKKKYALINKSGGIKIRGFELVRRDWSGIARKTQREVLEILLKEGDLHKARELVKKKIGELKGGKVPKSELVITTQLRKSTGGYAIKSPELAAVQKAREKGLKVEEHALVEYIITKKGKTISEKAQLAELVEEGDYDVEYYANNQLMPAVLKILGALGVDEGDLKQKGKQTGLGAWG